MADEKEIQIVKRESEVSALAVPLVNPEEAAMAMATYQRLCNSILIPWDKRRFDADVLTQDSDFQRIRVKDRSGRSYEGLPEEERFQEARTLLWGQHRTRLQREGGQA